MFLPITPIKFISWRSQIDSSEAHLDYGCHFNTPIATRKSIFFMRVALCIFGIGYGLPWYSLAPSFNSKETGSNCESPSMPSKLFVFEEQCKLWIAMWCAQVHAIVLDNAWKVCFVIFSIQDFHHAFGCITCTYWLLGKVRIELKCTGNARFELQIVDVPHGQEDVIDGDALFLKSNMAPISCKVCLPMIRLYNGCGPPLGYSTTSRRRCMWKCSMTLEQPYLKWVCTF